ncbi:MAG: DUF5654 family protein [bacterium]|nr:DUF5654 family protein [bacterium]
MPFNSENLRQQGEELQKEVRERSLGYITAALGLVAGLAWNEAIKGLIEFFFPITGQGSLVAKFLYAIAITIVVVLLTVYLARLMRRDAKES